MKPSLSKSESKAKASVMLYLRIITKLEQSTRLSPLRLRFSRSLVVVRVISIGEGIYRGRIEEDHLCSSSSSAFPSASSCRSETGLRSSSLDDPEAMNEKSLRLGLGFVG